MSAFSLSCPPRWPALVATAFLGSLTWALAHWLAYPNLDPYHDMLESYAWSQTFEWGTFKHPPLFAWVTGAWFSVFPRGDLTFKLLAYANVAGGLLGVAALARAYGMAQHSKAAMVLLLMCLPYTTLAAKFNANAQLLSIWPWAAAALINSITFEGKRAWMWSTLLGALAALCVLAKYFSGVFFVGLLAAALTHPAGLRWIRSFLPWWAAVVGLLILTPHLMWLHSSGFVLMRYAMDQGGGQTDWHQLQDFALLPFVYWLPGWWLCTAAFARSAPAGQRLTRWLQLLVIAWRPQGVGDGLFWLILTPWILSLAFGLAGFVALSSPWALPLGFAFPILWLRNLEQASSSDDAQAALGRMHHRFLCLGTAIAVLTVGAVLGTTQALSGASAYYRPTGEAAQAIAQSWQERHPTIALRWSAGAWPDAAMMAFYVHPSVRALPFAPDSPAAAIAPHPLWAEQGGVWVCTLGPANGHPFGPDNPSDCQKQASSWLTSKGLTVAAHRIIARREGFRFPHPQDWEYVAYDVLPLRISGSQGGKSPE